MRATSNRKLAEALGVSETAVRRALAAGRIARDPDGSFDVAKVKRQWGGNTDAAQQRPTAKAGLRPVPAAALASVRETLRDQGEEPAPGSPSFLQARTANEVLKAQERKLRLARLKGELIDRARATAQVFTLARQERDAWVQWPARVAADLAAELGLETHTVQTALEAAERQQAPRHPLIGSRPFFSTARDLPSFTPKVILLTKQSERLYRRKLNFSIMINALVESGLQFKSVDNREATQPEVHSAIYS